MLGKFQWKFSYGKEMVGGEFEGNSASLGDPFLGEAL